MLRRLFISLFLLGCALAGLSSAAAQQGFRIAGVVVDSISGAPLERAEVSIAPVANLTETLLSLTSADGKFFFAGLASGKYRLSASHFGYTQQGLDEHEGFMTAIAVGPKLDSEHIRFRLSRESVLAGNVSDDYADPVRDATVLLFQRKFFSGTRTTLSVARVTTDDLGNYRFAHLAPGTYSIAVHAQPWYGVNSHYGSLGNLRMRLAPAENVPARFSPEVVASLGDKADFSRIPEPAPNPLLDVVYPTSFFSNADSLESATPLSLAPGATATADFSLHTVPALRLFVRVPPWPFDNSKQSEFTSDTGPNLEASLRVAGEDFEISEVRPSPQLPGFFEVSGVPPGEVMLSLAWQKGGEAAAQTATLRVASETRVDMNSQAPLVSVSGTVPNIAPPAASSMEDATGQTPLLTLSALDGARSYSASIDAKGEFAFSVPAGQYKMGIALEPPPYVGSIEAAGATVSGRTITLAPGTRAKLTVHVTDANCTIAGTALKNGKPLGGVMILLVPEDPSQDSNLFHRDQSDSDGTFTLGQVLPGRYTLLAIENGWDLEWSNLSVLFKYLPNGKPLDLKPGVQISANLSVQ